MNTFAWGHYLPRLVSAALGLALIWQIAHWWTTSTSTSGNRVPNEAAVGRPTPTPAAAPSVDNGLAFPLFGLSAQPTASGGTTPPPTTLGLVLRGVLALGEGRGYALIDAGGLGAASSASGANSGTSNAAYGLYAVGEIVVGRVKLYRVYPDHVVLQTAHGLESLALQGNEGSTGTRTARAQVPTPPTTGTHRAVLNPAQSHRVAEVMHNPMQFRRYLRVVPVRRGDRQIGYQVSPAGDPRLFSALGLRAGDVITAVNGTPLDGGALNTFELVKALHDAHEISLRVLRHGHEIPLQVVMQGQ